MPDAAELAGQSRSSASRLSSVLAFTIADLGMGMLGYVAISPTLYFGNALVFTRPIQPLPPGCFRACHACAFHINLGVLLLVHVPNRTDPDRPQSTVPHVSAIASNRLTLAPGDSQQKLSMNWLILLLFYLIHMVFSFVRFVVAIPLFCFISECRY